ncbi:MAG: glycosyltransferase family 39 protein [Candidatus Dormibacteria bacterium]
MKSWSESLLKTLLASLRNFAGEPEEEGEPLQQLLTSLPSLLTMGAVGILALVMRLHDYALAPGLTDAREEYSFTWAGMQILRGHAPGGVSDLGAYAAHATDVRLFGLTFHVVHPWLDQPPLFGVLPGFSELARGFHGFGEISPEVMRLPSIALGVATVLLGYSLARRLLPPLGALGAGFLLAVEPGLVLLSRLAVPEAALAPMLLLAALLTTPAVPENMPQGSAGAGRAAEQAPRGSTMTALMALCFLAPLLRISGLVVPVAAVALLLARGLRREAVQAGAAGIGAVLLFSIYGVVLNPAIFLEVWRAKLAVGGGFNTALTFVTGSIGAGRPMVDAWYLFSWAALAYLAGNAKRRHRYRPLLWPIAIYLLLVLPFLAPGDLTTTGWTRLPILPLLLIGALAAIYAAVREGQLMVPVMAAASAGLWSIQWLFRSAFSPGALSLLVLLAVVAVPMAVTEIRARGRARDAALGLWAAFSLFVLAGDTVLAWNLAYFAGKPGLSPL